MVQGKPETVSDNDAPPLDAWVAARTPRKIGDPHLLGWVSVREAQRQTKLHKRIIQSRCRLDWGPRGLAAKVIANEPRRNSWQWRIDPRVLVDGAAGGQVPLSFGENPAQDLEQFRKRLLRAEQRFSAVLAVEDLCRREGLSRAQAIDAILEGWGQKPDLVVKMSARSILTWMKRYMELGARGLVDIYRPARHGRPLKVAS